MVKKKTDFPGKNLLPTIRDLEKELSQLKRNQLTRDQRKDREFRTRYHSFINNIADPVFIYDAITYRILYCNEAVLRNYGYSREEIMDMTPFDLHKTEDFGRLRECMSSKTGETPNIFTQLTKDQKERIVEMKAQDFYFEGNPAWLVILHDITERCMMEKELIRYRSELEKMVNDRTIEVLLTVKKLKEEIQERKRAEQIIKQNETKFRNIIENSLDGIILVDETGTVIEWNKGQTIIYGARRAMVVGKKIWDVEYQFQTRKNRTDQSYKKSKRIWHHFFKTGINPFKETLHIAQIETPKKELKEVQQLYFAITTEKGTMMACTSRDITALKAMEKKIIQSQKMDAMGALAGGIAHDFNNILSGIIGHTELALRGLNQKENLEKHLNHVLIASKRATELVKQILTFSRQEEKEKEPVQLALIVDEALKLMRSSLPANIDIVPRLEAETQFIQADATQIHQVIMNLCTNAGHAMKENGGSIEVRLTEENVEAGLYKDLAGGPHLRLSISDTGKGISTELIDKIFEPFFTTKKAGEGTGMGLAVVHGIIKSHNGNISVYSKEGEGTTFSILFPVVINVIHKETQEGKPIPGGSEKILVVEDDVDLMETERKLLQELGYQVTAVKSSVEALEICQHVPDRFDIMIIDYMMPKMNGLQLIRKIRDISPDTPIILCTGFSNVVTPKKAEALKIGGIIDKPIQLGKIAHAIRGLLSQAMPPAKKSDTEDADGTEGTKNTE